MRMYRGKPVDNPKGEFVHGWYVPLNGKHHILPDKPRYDDTLIDNLIEVIPETVSQSTGLKDTTDMNEVYCKDIVQRHAGEDKYIVEWSEYQARFYLKNLNKKSVMKTQEISLVRVCKILSNVVNDNPELKGT